MKRFELEMLGGETGLMDTFMQREFRRELFSFLNNKGEV